MFEIRCSGLARPMECAGFLFMKDLPPNETNAAAEEGTACGELLQLTLQGKPIGTHASNGVPFSAEMHFYVKHIAQQIINEAHSEILCETRIDWVTRSGIKICGSYDVSYIDKNGNLCVDDLKYGFGIVEVKKNWQLLGYAIGEVMRRQQHFPKIIVTIRQPRPHHEDGPTRKWELTYSQLLEWKEVIDRRMDQIAAGYNELVTGKQCKYCPAAAEHCVALNKSFYRGIEYVHEFVQDSMSEKELSHQLDLATRVTEVIKIKLDSLTALASNRINTGKIIPGYIAEPSYANRTWKPGISPATIKIMTGVEVIAPPEMLSVKQAEVAGVPEEFLKKMVERKFIKNKIVKKDASAVGAKIFGGVNA